MDVLRFKDKYMGSHQKLYRVAYRLLENEADAQDVVQDTYAKLWNKRTELEQIENGEAYAMMMLRNLCIDHLRGRSVRHSDSIEVLDFRLMDDGESSQQKLENAEDLSRIERIIGTLPEQQQMVVKLRHWNDLSIEEIETATGLTAVNVRVMLSRARKRIKELISTR